MTTTQAGEPRTAVPGRVGALTRRHPHLRAAAGWAASSGWPVTVYCATRLALLVVAWIDVLITHRPLGSELALFDGGWYLRLAQHGYPSHAAHAKSTLGFLPAYPLAMIAVARLLAVPLALAGRAISFCGGLAAAVLVRRVAAGWWGERAARRAVAVFCLFPGSVVFSMVYSEGLTLPLALGCLLALRSRRWALAGCLAGLAGTAEPVALVLIPVCLIVAWREISAAGRRDRRARASLLAPLLASSGIAAFAVFLWAWTGTPLACYDADSYGWHNGLVYALTAPLTRHLAHHPVTVGAYLGNPSMWNGLLGTVFLCFAVAALWRHRHGLPVEALAWTCGIGAVTLWSVMTLPNTRMLLIAFPAVIIWARHLPARRFRLFLVSESVLFTVTGGLVFAGHMLP